MIPDFRKEADLHIELRLRIQAVLVRFFDPAREDGLRVSVPVLLCIFRPFQPFDAVFSFSKPLPEFVPFLSERDKNFFGHTVLFKGTDPLIVSIDEVSDCPHLKDAGNIKVLPLPLVDPFQLFVVMAGGLFEIHLSFYQLERLLSAVLLFVFCHCPDDTIMDRRCFPSSVRPPLPARSLLRILFFSLIKILP